VNTFSVEDRTRTSQNPQRRHSRLESFDDQFESELPPEIRAELEAPVRIPETEQEIEAAMAWLKSRGYLPSESVPSSSGELSPPVSPPPLVTLEATWPAPQRESRDTGIWWLLAVLIGLPVLLAMLGQAGSRAAATQPPTPWVEVRRALPAIPHALPSTVAPVAAQWQSIRMPDGTIVSASFQGWLPSSADLPNAGHFLGEEFATGTVANPTAWIWMTRAGALSPSWVDP
jgi:hypothetical protein